LPDSDALPLGAQTGPRQLVGAGAGGAYGWQGGEIPLYPGSTDCGLFTSATVGTFWIGGVAIFPELLSPNLGIVAGVRWNSSSGLYTTSPNETLVLFDNDLGAATEIEREYRYSTSESMTTLDLALRYDLGRSLAVTAGLWGGIRSDITVSQVERSLDSRYAFNRGLSQDTTMTPGLLPTTEPIGFGLQAGGSYEIRPSDRISLQPEIALRFDLGSQIAESSWRRLSVSAGAHLLFDLRRDAPLQADPPVVAETVPTDVVVVPPAAAKKLSASLDLRAVDAEENDLPFATVTIYETHVHRRLPLPTVVDFAVNSAALPEQYRRTSPEDATSALVDTLASSSRDTIEAHLLDLLGLRMRESGTAKISLTGATGRHEAAWLAYARVETVRSYLQRVWGIGPDRMEVRAPAEREAGRRDDPPSVRIDGPRELIGQVDLQRIDREFEPPRIRIAPQWEAEGGLRNWSLRFRHGGTMIGEIDSRQADAAGVTSLNWQIVNTPAGAETEPLSAELTVEDSLGGVRRVADTIPLRITRFARIVDLRQGNDGGERVVYTLYQESSGERSRALARSLVGTLPRGARVSIGQIGENGAAEAAALLRFMRPLVAARPGTTLGPRIVSLDRDALGVPAIETASRTGTTALVIDLPAPRR
jgi:hypothetical protein